MAAVKEENKVKILLSMGIFCKDKKVFTEVFEDMGDYKTAGFLKRMDDNDFYLLSEKQLQENPDQKKPDGGLIVMYAGPGAGKSTVTDYLFKKIPLKWLVVYTTRDMRVSENEKIGYPFAKYSIGWDEFDSINDNDPEYIKTVSLDTAGRRSKGYVVDLKESYRLISKGYSLIIHSWVWEEFVERSNAFPDTLTICLYVDYRATVKRLAYRNLVEAEQKNLIPPETAKALPRSPDETDLNQALELLRGLEDKSVYEDLLSRIESAEKTRKTYETVLKGENIKWFKYIADNSNDPRKAMDDVLSIVAAEQYMKLPPESRHFTSYFGKFLSRACKLESRNWASKQSSSS